MLPLDYSLLTSTLILCLKKHDLERDYEYDWITIAKKRKMIPQPKPQLDELEIYKNFHRKPNKKHEDSQPKPYSHHFKPRKFSEMVKLNKTYDKELQEPKEKPYSDSGSEVSLKLDHHKNRKKIMLEVNPKLRYLTVFSIPQKSKNLVFIS